MLIAINPRGGKDVMFVPRNMKLAHFTGQGAAQKAGIYRRILVDGMMELAGLETSGAQDE